MMKQFSLRRNSKGMSLVEVMVALGITGIVSVAIMQVMTTSMKGIRFVNSRNDMQEITRALTVSFRDPVVCGGAFTGIPNVTMATLGAANGISVTARLPFLDTMGNVIIPAANQRYGALVIEGARLGGPAPDNPISLGPNAFLVPLIVNANAGAAEGTVGANIVRGSARVRLYTNGANTVTGCEADTGVNDLSNSQTFNQAGNATWTVPAGVQQIRVEVWGGGGGGGGGFANTDAPISGRNVTYGEGGGAGGYVSTLVRGLSTGDILSVRVGAGGAGGPGAQGTNTTTSNNGPGGNGGQSCVSTAPGCGGTIYALAPGGGGGYHANTGVATRSDGGTGGGWSNSTTINLAAFVPNTVPSPNPLDTVIIPGQWGAAINSRGSGGPGGSAPRGGLGGQMAPGSIILWGGVPLAITGTTGFDGFPGSQPGGGGGPTNHRANTAGAGADGRVVIYW